MADLVSASVRSGGRTGSCLGAIRCMADVPPLNTKMTKSSKSILKTIAQDVAIRAIVTS
jgi:hypothetical protein